MESAQDSKSYFLDISSKYSAWVVTARTISLRLRASFNCSLVWLVFSNKSLFFDRKSEKSVDPTALNCCWRSEIVIINHSYIADLRLYFQVSCHVIPSVFVEVSAER